MQVCGKHIELDARYLYPPSTSSQTAPRDAVQALKTSVSVQQFGKGNDKEKQRHDKYPTED